MIPTPVAPGLPRCASNDVERTAETSPRHCEELLRRSNQALSAWPPDCFATFAMENLRCSYLAPHSFATFARSSVTVCRMAEGVRENRGAGAGCTTPLWLTKVPRSAMCG